MKDGKQTGYESVGFQQAQKYKTTVLTVFCSRLRLKAQAEYGELVPQMSKLARSIPGYKSHRVFVVKDEERLTHWSNLKKMLPNSIGLITKSTVLPKSLDGQLFTVNTCCKCAK